MSNSGTFADSSGPDWEMLRNGVLLGGTHKLIERVPRWVGKRRFRARSIDSDEERMLVFFDPEPELWKHWQELAGVLLPMRDAHLLEILDLEQALDFHFIIAPWSNGAVLGELLHENGPVSPETARSMVLDLLGSLKRLGLADLPLPEISTETLLVEREQNHWRPLLFPLPFGFNGTQTESADPAAALRDLLFTLCTGLDAPGDYHARMLQLLPPPANTLWASLFNGGVTLESLESVLGHEVPALPPPRSSMKSTVREPEHRALPTNLSFPAEAPSRRAPGNASKGMGLANSANEHAFSNPVREQKRGTAWPVVFGSIVAAAGLAIVGWFAYAMVQTLREEPESELSFLVEQAPVAQDPRLPSTQRPESPARTADPGTGEARQTSDLTNLSPVDRAQVSAVRYVKNAGDASMEKELSEALVAVAGQADAIRAGTYPKLFKALEDASAAGSPSASLLLAKVLWGRDTDRSERLFIRLARQGNPEAVEFCEDQFIDWKEK